MYNLPHFKEKDQQVLLQFMKQNPFAMLIGCANDLAAATQIPILIEQRENKIFLKGHFLRNSDHHKAFQQNTNALCIFTGPHTYVSASVYTNPQAVSTWNYMSVHARGQINFLGEQDLLKMLEELTNQYEKPESAASYAQLPKEYVERLANAIIGFEIEVTEMDHVFKLSQNKDKENYQRIIQHLENKDTEAQKIAVEMRTRKQQVFKEQ